MLRITWQRLHLGLALEVKREDLIRKRRGSGGKTRNKISVDVEDSRINVV